MVTRHDGARPPPVQAARTGPNTVPGCGLGRFSALWLATAIAQTTRGAVNTLIIHGE